jgi:hypothetical protein
MLSLQGAQGQGSVAGFYDKGKNPEDSRCTMVKV